MKKLIALCFIVLLTSIGCQGQPRIPLMCISCGDVREKVTMSYINKMLPTKNGDGLGWWCNECLGHLEYIEDKVYGEDCRGVEYYSFNDMLIKIDRPGPDGVRKVTIEK